jgi:hypothetical protein
MSPKNGCANGRPQFCFLDIPFPADRDALCTLADFEIIFAPFLPRVFLGLYLIMYTLRHFTLHVELH